jgi:subtilisin family serine protease
VFRHALRVAIAVFLLAFAAPVSGVTSSANADGPAMPAIVVLRPGRDVDRIVPGLERALAVRAQQIYRHAFPGFAAGLTRRQWQALERDPSVAYITPDRPIQVTGQVVPTNVMRIGGTGSAIASIDGTDDRVDADIAIIDTGIQRHHPDLNVVGGYNCTTSTRTAWADQYGHGTHVAGTAAALDNGIGVVGVAPGARLWSVKVFDRWGWGRLSWYACGVDWVLSRRDPADPTRPRFEVANMSLRTVGRDDRDCGYTNEDPLHTAVCAAVSAGITVVVAAGNDSGPASSWVPAAYNEVITVAALADFDGAAGGTGSPTCYSWGTYDRDDTYADFSNHGSDVDIIAPGKCVLSTKMDSSYGIMSGTSMATPAVAGAAAIWLSQHPGDSPSHVRAVLQAAGGVDWATATDPDGIVDRLLNVSSFGAGADFGLDISSRRPVVALNGGLARFRLELIRRDGFGGTIDLAVSDLPKGASAELQEASLSGIRGLRTDLTLTVPPLAEGSYTATVSGSALESTRSTTARFLVDGTPPTVTVPRVHLRGPVVGQRTVPVSVSWSGRDAAAGVGQYRIERSTDGKPWIEVARVGGATTAITRSLADGHRYRYRVAAVDRVGNVSGWSTGATFRLIRLEGESRSVSHTASWARVRRAASSGGASIASSAAGAKARVVVDAREIAWIAGTSDDRGRATIYADGVRLATIDQYRSAGHARTAVFVRDWGIRAQRRLVFSVEGTTGRPKVDFDALIILR